MSLLERETNALSDEALFARLPQMHQRMAFYGKVYSVLQHRFLCSRQEALQRIDNIQSAMDGECKRLERGQQLPRMLSVSLVSSLAAAPCAPRADADAESSCRASS